MMPAQGEDKRGQKIHAKNENGISVARHCSIKPGFCQITGGQILSSGDEYLVVIAIWSAARSEVSAGSSTRALPPRRVAKKCPRHFEPLARSPNSLTGRNNT